MAKIRLDWGSLGIFLAAWGIVSFLAGVTFAVLFAFDVFGHVGRVFWFCGISISASVLAAVLFNLIAWRIDVRRGY